MRNIQNRGNEYDSYASQHESTISSIKKHKTRDEFKIEDLFVSSNSNRYQGQAKFNMTWWKLKVKEEGGDYQKFRHRAKESIHKMLNDKEKRVTNETLMRIESALSQDSD